MSAFLLGFIIGAFAVCVVVFLVFSAMIRGLLPVFETIGARARRYPDLMRAARILGHKVVEASK